MRLSHFFNADSRVIGIHWSHNMAKRHSFGSKLTTLCKLTFVRTAGGNYKEYRYGDISVHFGGPRELDQKSECVIEVGKSQFIVRTGRGVKLTHKVMEELLQTCIQKAKNSLTTKHEKLHKKFTETMNEFDSLSA
jgi:hypothetical protein